MRAPTLPQRASSARPAGTCHILPQSAARRARAPAQNEARLRRPTRHLFTTTINAITFAIGGYIVRSPGMTTSGEVDV